MIAPTPRFLALFALGLFFPFLSFMDVVPIRITYLFDMALLLFFLIDIAVLFRTHVSLQAIGPDWSFARAPVPFNLLIQNRSRFAIRIRAALQTSEGFSPREDFRDYSLPSNSEANDSWQIHAARRGEYFFDPPTLRIETKLGLAWRQFHGALTPKKHAILPRHILTKDESTIIRGLAQNQVGVLARRYFGKGSEFDQLRKYVHGDDYRTIDWKSSAKTERMVVRTYRPEVNQRVMIFLDLGRQMLPIQQGFSNLDWAVEAAQLLCGTALQERDHVGLLAFDTDIRTFVPPGQGPAQARRIAHSIYRLKPVSSEPDYFKAIQFFLAQEKRRSLVVLFTQVQDPDSASYIKRAMLALKPRHYPIVLNIAEKEIIQMALERPETEEEAFRVSAAIEVRHEIEKFGNDARQQGLPLITCDPEQVIVQTLNRYLSVKQKGLL